MIDKIVEDVRKALDSEAYLAALHLALTIPDVCGKAEYPNARVGERYKRWYDEKIAYLENPNNFVPEDMKTYYPYLSGEVLYQLRCSLFHEGDSMPDISNIKNELNKVDKFDLLIEENNEFNIYGGGSGYEIRDGEPVNKVCKISIQDICNKLCWVGEKYYHDNRDKFEFREYNIVDLRRK